MMRNIAEHIAADKADANMGKSIKRIIEEYEDKTGIAITKFGYTFDVNSQKYATGIRQIGTLTERKFWSRVSVKNAMDYYCDRKFQYVNFKLPGDMYKEKVAGKDYDEFLSDQLIFYKDTVFLLVY